MDGDQRLRRALAAFGGDVWALLDAALAAAARDRPEELCARRDAVVERLYAAAACSHCDGRPPRAALEEEAAAVSPKADADRVGDEEESSGLESKILAIRDFLEDLEQVSEESPSYHTSQRTRMRSSFFFHTRTFLLFCHSRRTSWRACCRTWRTWTSPTTRSRSSHSLSPPPTSLLLWLITKDDYSSSWFQWIFFIHLHRRPTSAGT
jgi:hypothetical protein